MKRPRSSERAGLDASMMRRALREARKGRTSPNPHVGAVVARNDEIIAVGHHARCGGPHAEVVALARAGARARGATLYVTLEPCDHQGRTGPCTEAVVAAGIKRVVVGCLDPTMKGRSSAPKLRARGIEVVVGEQGPAAERVIADFRIHRTQARPLTVLKVAVTLDGRIATRTGDSRWITGEPARREAHRLRAQSDAVMVGVQTVLADNPALTVRSVRGRDPLRVILDTHLRTPARAQLLTVGSTASTLILHGPDVPQARKRRLEREGVELAQAKLGRDGRLQIRAVLRELARRDVLRLLVEGGARVHGALLDAGLADRAAVFVAPRILGDPQAQPLAHGKARTRMAQAVRLVSPTIRRFGDDLLWTGDIARAGD